MSGKSACRWCGTSLFGGSAMCVRCYASRVVPCYDCMRQCFDGRYRPVKRGKPSRPIDCGRCNNERYILAE